MQSLRSEAKRFWDQWGTLDKHWRPDGGDSCHRVGMYYSLLGIMKPIRRQLWYKSKAIDFKTTVLKHHVAPGVLVRHPNLDWDASDWDRMSRDQLHPIIIACGYYDKEELRKLTVGHAKRLFLFTNNTRKNGATKRNHGKMDSGEVRDYGWKLPDVTLFEIWALFIRAWGLRVLWPLLWLLDLELLGGAIRWRYFRKHNIAMNHTLTQLQAMDRLPTPVSWLAEKIMPVSELIELIDEHFHDFPDDMIFFKQMFTEAHKAVKK